MALASGTRLGAYDIVTPIGAGGMGEVYRANDTRLDRVVALKVLSPSLAGDPQFRERFDREARTISRITHPHICTLYDVGEHEGTAYLVMELLEGETLADRLARSGSRALGLEETLRIAVEIADALDAAHRAGIVHRDLKPGNIFLARSGAKLLDFGLAKSGGTVAAGVGMSMAATTPPNITAQGTILGTFRYMAPEQIEGSEADARSDLWAFGCVLLEMLTGAPAFEGKTQASLIAAILEREPAAIATTPPSIDPGLDRIVRRCLTKDPERRWQSARDLRLELEWARTGQAYATQPASPRTPAARNLGMSALTLASVIAAVSSVVFYRSQSPAPAALTRFTIDAPDNGVFTPTDQTSPSAGPQLAVSPDGRGIAFVVTADGRTKIWVRAFDSVQATAVDGTEGAELPFWSPDGRALGFFADGKLKKVQLPGGPAQVVAAALDGQGGTWSADNVIVFSPSSGGPLFRVSASGGTR